MLPWLAVTVVSAAIIGWSIVRAARLQPFSLSLVFVGAAGLTSSLAILTILVSIWIAQ